LICKTGTMFNRSIKALTIFLFVWLNGYSQQAYHELYRPQIHFSPEANWMNDPNGLVYFQGTYHLFFQYYPDSTVWGPMHWGHAVSKDLVHWKQLAIALFPDSLGYIFSGSAVVDESNTSGFGTQGKIPLVAIYTQHDPAGEKAGTNHFQNQSIAYSLDAGNSWIKYAGNPVLKTPGLKDFRDPKVSWYPGLKKWIMALAAGDHIVFYSSVDLKTWNKESEFGSGIGAHGGVWECPDLVPFKAEGKQIWLLIVNMNPGGIQGGSGTQYFVGDFDGHRFICTDTTTKWADYGADNYAGVTWSNTGDEKIFMGWMSNWMYGPRVPTVKWRSAMTIPRVLGLKKVGNSYFTTMQPVDAIEKLVTKSYSKHVSETENTILTGPTRLEFTVDNLYAFSFVFSNAAGQYVVAGYDEENNSFFIDRTHAGSSSFDPGFARIHYGPRISTSKDSKITMILDNSSLELFADEGLTTMTEIFFPDQPFTILQASVNRKPLGNTKISELKSIWP
jgi:fructan beta-fructosidase